MSQLTQAQAERLAKHDDDYRARKLHGRWVVWCDASDHVVEFDARTIAAAAAGACPVCRCTDRAGASVCFVCGDGYASAL